MELKQFIQSLFIAFSTYSRIPVPRTDWSDGNRKYAMCFFPLVGAAVGGALWLWLSLSERLSFGPLLRGAVAAVIPLIVTGGIHMDGFMDTLDALASGKPKEEKLRILKDSRSGAFAVMGCASYLLLTAALLSEARAVDAPTLFPVYVVSRAMSALTMTALPSARPGGMLDGFSHTAEKRTVRAFCVAYLLLCFAAWLRSGILTALLCAAVAAAAVLGYRRMALREFGGATGDLAGWFLEVAEICLTAVVLTEGRIG